MNAAFTNKKVFSLMNIAFRYHCIPNLLYSQYTYDSIFSSYVIYNQYYLSQGFRAIFLRIFCEIAVRFFKKCFYYRAIIAHQKSCEKLANRRTASDEKPTPGVALGTFTFFVLISL